MFGRLIKWLVAYQESQERKKERKFSLDREDFVENVISDMNHGIAHIGLLDDFFAELEAFASTGYPTSIAPRRLCDIVQDFYDEVEKGVDCDVAQDIYEPRASEVRESLEKICYMKCIKDQVHTEKEKERVSKEIHNLHFSECVHRLKKFFRLLVLCQDEFIIDNVDRNIRAAWHQTLAGNPHIRVDWVVKYGSGRDKNDIYNVALFQFGNDLCMILRHKLFDGLRVEPQPEDESGYDDNC